MGSPDSIRPVLRVRGASENNLRGIDVDIPHDRITVVTGVSGSGKSSLAFDVVFQEARRRYLESFSSQVRQFLGRLRRPAVDRIEGLRPAAAVGPRTSAGNPRSTVGTLTEIHDWLRLLYARLGQGPAGLRLERSLFSFNSPRGACPACRGLGVEDRIDPDLLVADPARSLRRGALALTTPTGYIIYSQVTLDVLDSVCRAHGFSIDVPWKDLGPDERRVVLEGSDRIRIPFGKHPLESRMRWTGITPKPRQEGTYKGILPIMEAILKAKRNPNILRFARTLPCRACGGSRLRPEALAVKFRGRTIAQRSRRTVRQTADDFQALEFSGRDKAAGEAVRFEVAARTSLLLRLGLGHLTLDRDSSSLSGGEAQRIRLAAQVGSGLRGMLYVFDEPTAGLHPAEAERLFGVLRELRDNGNTILIVEHEEAVMRAADHLIDLGPGAGPDGGRVLFSGPPEDIVKLPAGVSPTRDVLAGNFHVFEAPPRRPGRGTITVRGARLHNLRRIRAEFKLGAFNVVSGVSGAGKTTLVRRILAERLSRGRLGPGDDADGIDIVGRIGRIMAIDQAPIGRTPRSNPATYTGFSDRIRDLFAAQPAARERGWGKSRFSFNAPGGRCEDCRGAGLIQIGMHFLGQVDVLCPVCEGGRFNAETLEIRYRGKTIRQVFDLNAADAEKFFRGEVRLERDLAVLVRLGLGYLKLGQSSTTLSGGEAQRVKLAAELMRPEKGDTVYVLEEPTAGLHARDIGVLLAALQDLIERGNTIVAVEHNPDFIRAADHAIDLGPGSGDEGGRVVVSGTPEEIAACAVSLTGQALRRAANPAVFKAAGQSAERADVDPSAGPILLNGVSTHNLRGVDAAFPFRRFTVVSGPSGSGKSSLVFDTLFAESRRRFIENFSTYVRGRLDKGDRPDFASARGLTPPIAAGPRTGGHHPRSTVGTMTEIYDDYRVLFSRAGRTPAGSVRAGLPASHFSFNHEAGACPRCKGLGWLTSCDPRALVTYPERPLVAGALDGTKTGRFYGDPNGQHVAALLAAGRAAGVDFSVPYSALSDAARRLAFDGGGNEVYEIVWAYKRGRREGDFRFRGPWSGLIPLVDAEYERKHADHRGQALRPLMAEIRCPECGGARLKPEVLDVTFAGRTIAELSALSIGEAEAFFASGTSAFPLQAKERAAAGAVIPDILRRLRTIRDVGLDYLSVDRRASTLSGGESQRVKLASLLGAKLTGITYLADEPTLGLHAKDIDSLIELFRRLVDEGNTVVAVEHDLRVAAAADHIIDLGPGAGRDGGRIVALGSPPEIEANPDSPTGRAMRTKPIFAPLALPGRGPAVVVVAARANNLRLIDAEFPARTMTVVTGVSGSGKTSLVLDVLHRSARAGRPVECDAAGGLERFSRIVLVDQEPPPSSAASIVLTFMGLFDAIRALYGRTDEAKALHFKAAHFSFASPQGRCPLCRGTGKNRVALDFVADVESPCEECGGSRYRPEVLAVRWNGRTIAETLAETVAEAVGFVPQHSSLHRGLALLAELGLGYLRLGQSLDALSGGEGQRLKLAAELCKPASGEALFLFDEPTAGLHASDVVTLLAVFARLIAEGHTLIVVEHDLDVIGRAGHVIDLGPGGGLRGGLVIASGPPAAIAANEQSFTGRALRARLGII